MTAYKVISKYYDTGEVRDYITKMKCTSIPSPKTTRYQGYDCSETCFKTEDQAKAWLGWS